MRTGRVEVAGAGDEIRVRTRSECQWRSRADGGIRMPTAQVGSAGASLTEESACGRTKLRLPAPRR